MYKSLIIIKMEYIHMKKILNIHPGEILEEFLFLVLRKSINKRVHQ